LVTSKFMKLLRAEAGTAEELLSKRDFMEWWVEGTGVALLTVGVWYNPKARTVHVVLRQAPHPVTGKLFAGRLLVQVRLGVRSLLANLLASAFSVLLLMARHSSSTCFPTRSSTRHSAWRRTGRLRRR
jgi:hypothetical protein